MTGVLRLENRTVSLRAELPQTPGQWRVIRSATAVALAIAKPHPLWRVIAIGGAAHPGCVMGDWQRGDAEEGVLNLDVYDTREGLWNPEHGSIELPDGWEFLPASDTFVTRKVKSAGVYWTAWRPRGRNRPHRRKLGLFAPIAAIARARDEAEQTTARRARQREVNARHRDKVEDAYRSEFAAAVVAWLDFAPEHAALAEQIATSAADRAVVVGSGRVGRTRLLPLEERAAVLDRWWEVHRTMRPPWATALEALDRMLREGGPPRP